MPLRICGLDSLFLKMGHSNELCETSSLYGRLTMRQLELSAGVLLAEAQTARRPDAAPILRISAQYSFKNWFDSQGKIRKFACRMVGISPHEMVLIVPVIGRAGAGVAVECEEFG